MKTLKTFNARRDWLCYAGFMFVLIGVSLVLDMTTTLSWAQYKSASYQYIFQLIPKIVWAPAYIVSGLLSIWCGRTTHHFGKRHQAAFGLIVGITALWTAGYVLAAVQSHLQGPTGILIWGTLCIWTAHVARNGSGD